MSYKTETKTIIDYMENVWKLNTSPKLIISVLNSNIQSESNKSVYINGLVKASMDAGKNIYFISVIGVISSIINSKSWLDNNKWLSHWQIRYVERVFLILRRKL